VICHAVGGTQAAGNGEGAKRRMGDTANGRAMGSATDGTYGTYGTNRSSYRSHWSYRSYLFPQPATDSGTQTLRGHSVSSPFRRFARSPFRKLPAALLPDNLSYGLKRHRVLERTQISGFPAFGGGQDRSTEDFA